MITMVLTSAVRLDSFADSALASAARLWFVVAVSGQLMLATYVAWFYGSTAVEGRLDLWSRVLTRGYIRGDAAGNTAVIAHLIGAVVLALGGAVQLIPRMRERFPRFHRWAGRVYLLTAVAGSLSGLYLTWIRGTRGDLPQHIGGSVNAVLILACAALALRSAITRQFVAHRRWALRLYLAVSASYFYRIGLFLWILMNQGPAGFDLHTFRGPALTFISFANSIVPLVVLQLYLYAKGEAAVPGRLAMACGLFVLTAGMAAGIFGATIGMWVPIVTTRYLPF